MRGPLVLIVMMILAGTATQGHHSIAAAYDRAKPVKLDAVVVEFAMVQPHPFVIPELWKKWLDTAEAGTIKYVEEAKAGKAAPVSN